MVFLSSLSKMLVILCGIGTGYLANRLKIMGGEVDQRITKLILTITLPAMTLGAVSTGQDLPDTAALLGILKVAAIYYALAFLTAALVPYVLGGTPGQRGVWRFAVSFANVGFMGIPVCTLFFGDGALIYAVILMLPFNVLSYSLGTLMLTGGIRDFQAKRLLSPCVLASLLALVLTLARVRPPAVVGECLNFVGDITTPMSLLIIGSLLAGLPMGQVFAAPRLWGLAAFRLAALPAALFLILEALGTDPMAVRVAVTQMAMPVAANGTMLCLEYGGDKDCMAQATFLTTLLSMVTVPVLAAVLFPLAGGA